MFGLSFDEIFRNAIRARRSALTRCDAKSPSRIQGMDEKNYNIFIRHHMSHIIFIQYLHVFHLDETFETKYQKIYSFDERKKRAQIFQENFMMIEEHNSESSKTWTMEINEVSNCLFIIKYIVSF